MRMALRDAMVMHAGVDGDLPHLVTRARWFVNFLAKHTNAASVWGQIYRHEAALLAGLPDDYIGHEFLEDVNEPMTFTAFAGLAGEHGLAYLGDAEISGMIPENLDPATAVMLREMCGGKALPVEQYMDVVTGRTFRQSLLVGEAIANSISRTLEPARLMDMHLVARADLRRVEATPTFIAFGDNAGRRITSGHPAVVAALDSLVARLPSSAAPALLMPAGIDDASRTAVLDAFIKMLQVGLLSLSLEPATCDARIADKPRADPLARHDAAQGGFAVNRRHESINLGVVAREVLPLLDGAHDRAALREKLVEAVGAGRVTFLREGMAIASAEGIAREAASHVETTLAELARAGLLIETE
jgi:methyltransferase-like protein